MIHYFNFYFKVQFQHILGNIPSHLLSSCCLSCNQVALTKTCKYQWISAAAVTQSITSAAQSNSFVALPHLTRAGLCWWLAKHCFAAEHVQTPVLTKQHLFAPLKLGPNAPVLAARTAYHGFHFRQYNPDQEQVLALQGQAPRLPHGMDSTGHPSTQPCRSREVSATQDTAEPAQLGVLVQFSTVALQTQQGHS